MKPINGSHPAGLNIISPMNFIPHASQFSHPHNPILQTPPTSSSSIQHQANSQTAKPSISEPLDKIREQFALLEAHNLQLRLDSERLQAEKSELQKQQVMYYEMCYGLNMDVQKTSEINKRLTNLVTQYLPHLPQEMQAHVMANLDKAKQVSVSELSALLGQQMAQAQTTPLLPPNLQSIRFPPQTIINSPGINLSSTAQGCIMPLLPPPNLQAIQTPVHPSLIKQELMEPKSTSPPSGTQTRHKSPNNSRNSSQNLTNRAKRAREEISPHSSDEERSDTELVVDDDEPSPDKIHLSNRSFQPLSNTTKLQPSKANTLTLSASSNPSRVYPSPVDSPTSKQNKVDLNLKLSLNVTSDSPHNGSMTSYTRPDQVDRIGRTSAFTQSSQRWNPHSILLSNPKQSSSTLISDGTAIPYSYSPLQNGSYPKDLKVVREFSHEEVVCAVWLEQSRSKIFAGDKGSVKVWDINQSNTPAHTLDCEEDTYLRFCKLIPDRNHLIVGGELSNLCVFDIQSGSSLPLVKHNSGGPVYYALALSQDGKYFFTCGSDGKISIWNSQTFKPIKQVDGHGEGASSIDISADGNTLFTGGLDHTVKSWDIRELDKVKEYSFSGQIFALGACPSRDWLAVGNENASVEVQNLRKDEHFRLNIHTQSILTLKYATDAQWCLTGGKDSVLNLWHSPSGQQLVSRRENSSVLSSDISQDDKYIVTGSGDKKTTLYEIVY
ncbi:Groucho [Oopsacas minuta]|uniref:Groucho n=1 Tax=Oopsacas minuta TaxID=111878 RepID=A0A2H4G8J6_9METZ|nr:Groucho [Oopsacas minuta]KAI6661672.1 Groucho [Oopsacas minuta]